MKRLLAALLLLPLLAVAAPYDLVIQQRNATDTGLFPNRLVAEPPGGASGVMGYNATTRLPVHWALGSGLSLTGSTLSVQAPAWNTITGTPTTLAGYGISDGVTQAGLTSLLTGYATNASVNAGLAVKFNNPSGNTGQYIRGDGSLATFPTLNAGTVTSITAGSGLSGGTITTSGTISLPAVGAAGSYANVTTDAQGRVTAGTNRSQSAATRALNTAFQISATRDADARYSVQCTVTANIAGGQNCDIILEIASDSAFTQNVQTVGIVGQGQTYTLAVAIQGVQPQTLQVVGYVPAGYYARIRTVTNTGSPTFAYRAGQEILH